MRTHIRMDGENDAPIGTLDFPGRRLGRHAQHFVKISPRHNPSPVWLSHKCSARQRRKLGGIKRSSVKRVIAAASRSVRLHPGSEFFFYEMPDASVFTSE